MMTAAYGDRDIHYIEAEDSSTYTHTPTEIYTTTSVMGHTQRTRMVMQDRNAQPLHMTKMTQTQHDDDEGGDTHMTMTTMTTTRDDAVHTQ